MDSVLIRYHEIALKKGNRPYFTELLKRNLLAAVRDLGVKEIRSLPARVLVTFKSEIDTQIAIQRIRTVFGVANFSPVERTARDIEVLRTRILKSLNGIHFASFRVDTQRGDKTFSLTSPEINRQLGAAVKEKAGARVDLSHPEFTVTVEILPQDAFFAFDKIPGAGGLPVGASGRVVSLISGGIDSPVAAYRMMQRGCRLIFVHFHSTPYLDKTSQEKVRQLVTALTRHQFLSHLYLVPFAEIKRQIVADGCQPPRLLLYRRIRLRGAEKFPLFPPELLHPYESETTRIPHALVTSLFGALKTLNQAHRHPGIFLQNVILDHHRVHDRENAALFIVVDLGCLRVGKKQRHFRRTVSDRRQHFRIKRRFELAVEQHLVDILPFGHAL